jgi:IMP dehydrogenase
MDSVIGPELAEILVKNGTVPIFHRFTAMAEKEEFLKKFPDAFMSIGLKDYEDAYHLNKFFGCNSFCIDTAHGHCAPMLDLIKHLKDKLMDVEIIAGNVCTPRAVHDLYLAGADAIKVGVGPGAACTTRSVTGFGVPQFTTIQLCAEEAKNYKIPIIADGGIRGSRDIVLALAAGADSVMVGKLFALCEESAAEKENISCSVYAKYRGQASEDFQKDFFGQVKDGTVPEGEAFWADVIGPAQDLINELVAGIRSGFTYGGARSIEELQRKAEFTRVTPAYSAEMGIRDV